MTQSSANRLKRLLPHFGSVRFAVFNVYEYDIRKARERVIREFGKEAYNAHVKPFIRTGIMEMFQHTPTRVLKRFAWYCVFASEKRHGKRRHE